MHFKIKKEAEYDYNQEQCGDVMHIVCYCRWLDSPQQFLCNNCENKYYYYATQLRGMAGWLGENV